MLHPANSLKNKDLIDYIREKIAKEGSISFEKYMELALYTPDLGYYMSEQLPIGKAGDFTTAPELSPFFSQCLAIQLQQIMQKEYIILEIGAGSGKMAAHLLKKLEELNALPKEYWILEISPFLREHQYHILQEHCSHLLERVKWIQNLSCSFEGIVLANEFLDALPVHRFRVHKQQLYEWYIQWYQDHFIGYYDAPHSYLKSYLEAITFPCDRDDYESECNLQMAHWIKNIANILKKGWVFFIDYGFLRSTYYHSQRTRGTLQCHYQHQVHYDPLILTGMQDITSFIDFTHLAELAQNLGFEIAGFTHQAAFLLNCGLLDRIQISNNPLTLSYMQNIQAIKQLVSPQEMGENIKVFALSKKVHIPLLGYKEYNKVHLLSCPTVYR